MDNAQTFGAQAKVYALARPGYPDALFDWVAQQSPGTDLVWDAGTGSGQAAKALAARFDEVHATDLDVNQIAQAAPHPRVSYVISPAHRSGLAANCVDAVTAATALHWFDFPKFWAEVKRVSRPGALFCAWTYHRSETDEDVRQLLLDPILKIVEPYWSEGNRLTFRGYSKAELAMPFDVIETPDFACELMWTPAQISLMTQSWSAHKKARLEGFEEELRQIADTAISKLGDDPRYFKMPLNMLAARIS